VSYYLNYFLKGNVHDILFTNDMFALFPISPIVFRTILKTYNLAPGDFPDIQSFASKLTDVKFSDFANFSQRQIDELDMVLNVEIPKLMSVRCKRLPVNVADLYVKFLTVYVFRLPSIGTTE
jgi:Domain of unknown function (DUF5600)